MTDEKDLVQIPYFCHEGEMNRLERVNRRYFVIILILILILVGSNVAWMVYESQFETVTTTTETVEIEATDEANVIGFIGSENEVSYYGNESKDHKNDNNNKTAEADKF